MMELSDQQEILMNAADIIIGAYQMETAILRAQKIAEKGDAASQIDMPRAFSATTRSSALKRKRKTRSRRLPKATK